MEASDIEKCEENELLSIKKIKNKYPVSAIILLILKWLDSISFSGMSGLLVLYFISQFVYFSTYEFYLHNMFKAYVVILAFVAATITDSWIGKFKAFIGSNIFLLLSHFTVIIKELLSEDIIRSRFLVVLGLFFMALATGIKMPCILCLAGDQFPKYQVKERNKVFSFLYMSTVFGTFFADIFIPFIMGETCSRNNCYLIYFGSSAGIVTFNLVIFILSKNSFFIEAPQGSKLWKILMCVQYSIRNQLQYCFWKAPRRNNCLDWASQKYSETDINEVKCFFRMLLFLSPFPIFWALVEKQSVEWITQAKKMQPAVAGYPVENANFQLVFTAALLFSLIVIELVFVPLAECLGKNFSLRKRTTVGIIFIYLSSLTSFFLELKIENSPNITPGSRESFIRILNAADTSFQVTFIKNKSYIFYSKRSQIFESSDDYERIYLDSDQQYFQVKLHSNVTFKREEMLLEEKTAYVMILFGSLPFYSIMLIKETTTKPENGVANVRIINILDKDVDIITPVGTYHLKEYDRTSELNIRINGNTKLLCMIEKKDHVLELGALQFGASYLVFITEDIPELKTWKIKQPEIKSFSIVWQLPQLLVMGIGKYLLIVSCMELFYCEAPKGMKVTMQALWTSTLFSSSLILYCVTHTSFLPKWIEYFLLSSFLLVWIIIFFIISYFYQEIPWNYERESFS
ncbi:solute carrier family 15 member 2-like [Petaurus breviceps papuanus]|uniref:solute carrier family 15 member 2-like n=1 Tax=Petaurus breviceps papuanus TaxID=3040969 RepID=UPI0036DAE4B2